MPMILPGKVTKVGRCGGALHCDFARREDTWHKERCAHPLQARAAAQRTAVPSEYMAPPGYRGYKGPCSVRRSCPPVVSAVLCRLSVRFQGGPPGRTRRRLGALAAAPADAPAAAAHDAGRLGATCENPGGRH